MKILFSSFGCKVNSIELESIREQLLQFGHTDSGTEDIPDIIILNTCSVTSTAEAKLRRAVRSLNQRFPLAQILLLGCYVSRDADTTKNLPGVTSVYSNTDKDRVLDLLCADFSPACRGWFPVSTGGTHTRGFLKIQDGCCNSCSYCVVSILRGEPRSRPKQDILAEIAKLCDVGVPEIVISGINLGSWGMEIGSSFSTLLRAIADSRPSARIRISSLELEYLTNEVLEIMAENSVFCRHIHVPLQSGADEVLASMNRRYDSGQYLARIERARSVLHNPGITTDIIVGYPTEGESEFAQTVEVARKAGFHRIHSFSYSPREGTTSFQMGNPIAGDEKRRRVSVLADIARENLKSYVASLEGHTLSVVFDGDSSKEANREGYSEEYLRVISGGFSVAGSTLLQIPGYKYRDGQVVMTKPLPEGYL